MRLALRFSILGNVVLFTGLAISMLRPLKQIGGHALGVEETIKPRPDHFVEQPPVAPHAKAFSWTQVESADYRVYVANLRAIDCPEQTIRDIIRADVQNLYESKRRELHLGERAGSWSIAEENRLIVALLDLNPDAQTTPRNDIVGSPTLPLVFRKIETTALQLDEEQRAALAELRREFIDEIGGMNQNPSEPAYAARWRAAQPRSDYMLRGMIGVSAFMRYQNESE